MSKGLAWPFHFLCCATTFPEKYEPILVNIVVKLRHLPAAHPSWPFTWEGAVFEEMIVTGKTRFKFPVRTIN